MLYELETGFREDGWPSEEFVYDAERDLYRFPDGEFAFSREYPNERRLREMGSSSNLCQASFKIPARCLRNTLVNFS